MTRLHNRHILLGVTGGIAAYKSAELVRRLRDAGVRVRVVMTRAATEFVTPLTFQALSGEPVHLDLLDERAEAAMGHIELARWADAVLVAPATADFIARLVQGRGDDLLSTLCLATAAPLALAPAMNQQMWASPATQDNIATLRERGVQLFGPTAGDQACGDTGMGRMLEVPELVTLTDQLFDSQLLAGLRVMITAGPTHEALDPVRFIGNHSSGRMGFALAEAARDAGARVTLVAGPVALETPADIERIDVVSAQQMYEAVMTHIAAQDLFIGCAAVADYRPVETAEHKIKKSAERLSIELQRNPDILAEVAALDSPPFCVGFAAETDKLEQYARAKLAAKKLHMIAANAVGGTEDSGFNSAYNALQVYWPDGSAMLEKAGKPLIARQLIELIAQHYKTSQ
jgi:phosphopantothenoylcysteine decarboxylase/phosphopantothenate--cysteine ligase